MYLTSIPLKKTKQLQGEALNRSPAASLKPLNFLRRLQISISGKPPLMNVIFSVLRPKPKPKKRRMNLEERPPGGSRFPIPSRSLS